VAGGASMTAKLAQWYACTEFRSWVNTLVSAYNNSNNFVSAASTANRLIGTDVGGGLVQVSIATAGVVVYCAVVTPKVFALVVNTAKNTWNKIPTFINGMFPPNINVGIIGIPFL
jgi:hypothetical protein